MWRVAHDDGFDSMAEICASWSVDDVMDACEVMDVIADVTEWRRERPATRNNAKAGGQVSVTHIPASPAGRQTG